MEATMMPDVPLSVSTLLQHGAWVQRLAERLVANRSDAEDLAQEALLIGLEHVPSERPWTWLAGVVRNLARRRARTTRRVERREREAAQPERLTPADDLVLQAERQRRLIGLVMELEE